MRALAWLKDCACALAWTKGCAIVVAQAKGCASAAAATEAEAETGNRGAWCEMFGTLSVGCTTENIWRVKCCMQDIRKRMGQDSNANQPFVLLRKRMDQDTNTYWKNRHLINASLQLNAIN